MKEEETSMRVRPFFFVIIASILACVISGCGLGDIGTDLGMKMAGISRDLDSVQIPKGSRVIIFTSEPGFSGYAVTPLGDRLDMLEVEFVFPPDASIYKSGSPTPGGVIKDMLSKVPADFVVMITLPRGKLYRAMISWTRDQYFISVHDSSGKTIVNAEVPASEVGPSEDDLLSWLKSNLNIK
jgi:hypothetical protein